MVYFLYNSSFLESKIEFLVAAARYISTFVLYDYGVKFLPQNHDSFKIHVLFGLNV